MKSPIGPAQVLLSTLTGGGRNSRTSANQQFSPGKRPSCQWATVNLDADASNIVHLKSSNKSADNWSRADNHAQFDMDIKTYDIDGYATHYHEHPRKLIATKLGWTIVSDNRCKYTGLKMDKLQDRLTRIRAMRQVRRHGKRQQRRDILVAADLKYRQEVVAAFVCATRTPGIKQKGAKRQGGKAVKKLETLPVGTTVLVPRDATSIGGSGE